MSIKKRQSGMSLIELMIAMLIGLFLLAGIATSYVSTKRTSVKRDQLSSIEDNGRLALEIITKVIEHAGYIPPNMGANRDLDPFITNPNNVVSASCADGSQSVVNRALFGASRMLGDSPSGDTLAVIQYGDDRLFSDCAGNSLPKSCRFASIGVQANNNKPEASKIYNSFYLNRSQQQLRCAGSRSANTEIIAEGIENIQFLYGVVTGENGVKRYMNATNLALSQLWKSVDSIQVAILVRSLKPVKKYPESKEYTLLDQKVTTPNDLYGYAVFTTTVRLRNNN